MEMKIEPASKERTEQGEQFIERLLKTLQNNDKVTVNIMYCQTCVIDSLASIDSGTSYNVNLGQKRYPSIKGNGLRITLIKIYHYGLIRNFTAKNCITD